MKLSVKGSMFAFLLCAAPAFAQTPFYQGKTITVIATTSPGGTGDMRVKSLLPTCANIFRGIPRWSLNTWTAAAGAKAPTISFATPSPTVLPSAP